MKYRIDTGLKISSSGLLAELTESSVQGALVGGGGSVLGLGSDIGGRQVSLFHFITRLPKL